jgi:hypothetical protein
VKSIIQVVLITLLCHPVYSQLSPADSMALHQAIAVAKQKYLSEINANAHVFNGPEYVSPVKDKKEIGDPFYLDYDWQEGNVHYEGQLYERIPIRYDIYQDKLLVEYSQGYESIQLDSKKIKYFEINSHLFVWLSSTANQVDISEGFYDLLYAGNVSVYAKRSKSLKEIMDMNIMKVEYIEKRKLFLHKDERFYVITKKSDIWDVFGAHKAPLKKFISREKINFRSNPESALVAIGKHYDELTK